MARVRLCVCGSWFVGREGQAAHPRAPGQCLHFECRGAPARVRVWRCEGRPPLPQGAHHFVCVKKFTLPYLVMQYGYDDELYQAWRDGKIGEKDLPEEVMAMTLDLCERWRAEQERCRRVHAAQRLSRDPGPSRSRSRSRSPNSCRSSVPGCDEG